ncbi:hypothetical protein ACGFQG_00790 [Nocardia fluminea]|uniref:hypothetical protein n=1 Tax=Nocardia fluminea TaxID=134984 RepID=UPI00371D2107
MLHQREGYWETRKEPTWSRGWMFDADNTCNVLHAEGVLGVRYDAGLCDEAPGIVIALGHAPSGLNLELAVDEAMELIEMLAAAIGEAHGVPQPSIDVTGERCRWACCNPKAVR